MISFNIVTSQKLHILGKNSISGTYIVLSEHVLKNNSVFLERNGLSI